MINILAELERSGIEYGFANADEVSVKCPFHDDSSPSCHIHLEKQLFICRSAQCGQKGDFIALLARYLKTTRKVVMEELGKRYQLNDEQTINVNVVEKYHARIWNAHPLRKELYKRGLTDADIRKYRLGEWQGRITIPVKNEEGYFVNIRSYLPGAPGADKMKNLKGRGKKLRLYPYEQMSFNKVIITGGEIKAIAAAAVLNPHGYGVVCATAGEGNWQHYLTPLFQGKDTWTMMDIDEAGKAASEIVNKHLQRITVSTHRIDLPLDPDLHPKGDVNDFLAEKSGADLLKLVKETPEWEHVSARRLTATEPEDVTLTQASHADVSGKRLRLSATVTTLDTSPYVIPKDVVVACTRDQNECSLCPVFVEQEDRVYTIQAESIAILEMMNARRHTQAYPIKEELEIPSTCQVCRFTVNSFYNVEDARISPQLEITERNNERALQPAVCIGDGLELNESYEFIGRMHPHPETQQSTLLISKYKATQDALSSYECTRPEALKLFQPAEWTLESLESKLDLIYEDFEANVTNIFQRRDLHLFCDLAYHSPLFIQFDRKEVKGWVEVLIVGDSAQGKSETALNIQKHYSLGEKVECKNATVAGLLGGLQQFGSRWFVTWGLFPTHDRRLVILEELKGASVEVISKLTDMRSSGIAEIPKIEKRRTHARTRGIWLSNPRSNNSIDRYNFGIQAIFELIGSLEDIRRFDACLIVEKSEVDAAAVNQLGIHRPQVPHLFTSQLCRELVLWAWTVKRTVYLPEAELLILEEAQKFCADYTEAIPIVDRGSMRYKIARLSAALAARTFSKHEDDLIIRTCHVQCIVNLLRRTYDSAAFGYRDFTAAESMQQNLCDPELIIKRINDTPFPTDVVKHLLFTERIEINDLIDWCAWERSDAQQFLSLLVRKNAITRERRHYRKTSPFIALLKSMKPVERPDFIEEQF